MDEAVSVILSSTLSSDEATRRSAELQLKHVFLHPGTYQCQSHRGANHVRRCSVFGQDMHERRPGQ